MNDDTRREFAKVQQALIAAERHHTARDESNAALHLSHTVLHTPLTTTLIHATASAVKVSEALAAPEPDTSAPGYVHAILDAWLNDRPLDFEGAEVPQDVQDRLARHFSERDGG